MTWNIITKSSACSSTSYHFLIRFLIRSWSLWLWQHKICQWELRKKVDSNEESLYFQCLDLYSNILILNGRKSNHPKRKPVLLGRPQRSTVFCGYMQSSAFGHVCLIWPFIRRWKAFAVNVIAFPNWKLLAALPRKHTVRDTHTHTYEARFSPVNGATYMFELLVHGCYVPTKIK